MREVYKVKGDRDGSRRSCVPMHQVSLGEGAVQAVEGWLFHLPTLRRGTSPGGEALCRAHAQEQPSSHNRQEFVNRC